MAAEANVTTFDDVQRELATRWPDADVVPTLERELALMEAMGSPQTAYPVIHVAGTNGKSSTSLMIDALLRAHGLRVGRFTSPSLNELENIAVDGVPVSRDVLVAGFTEVMPYVEIVDQKEDARLTRFEVLTAMAFAIFADAPVDVAVIEVGMGGAWDCTNVADGTVAALTPIGIDHVQYLGDTISAIAHQKAGIIKPGATVICADQVADARHEIFARAEEVGASVAWETEDFGVLRRDLAVGGQVLVVQGLAGVYEEIFLPLHGGHQAQNAAVALAAVEAFLGAGASTRQLDPQVVREGFATAHSPGRLERVRTAPTILLDAAHNPHGMTATVTALGEEFAFSRLVAVLGVLTDKDVLGMLELLEPVVDLLVCTRSTSPRAMSPDRLAELAVDVFGPGRVTVRSNLPDAIETAVALAESDVDSLAGVGILITGSVTTVADARALLVRERS